MKRLLGIVVVGGLAMGALFLSGCASSSKAATDADTHAYMDGMMCPKCETVWVAERKTTGPRQINRLSHSREMTCPDCDAMARSQLQDDGKVQLHECPTCKVTPKPIKPTEHPKHFHPKKGMHG